MTTIPSSSLRDLIDKAMSGAATRQTPVAENKLEVIESKLKPLQDFLLEVTSVLGDIKYKKDYILKNKEGSSTGYEDMEDILERAVAEHKDDNTYKAIMQILSLKKSIEKLETLLTSAKVIQDKYEDEVLPSLNEARRKIEDKIIEVAENLKEVVNRNSEAYIMYHLMQLSQWKKQMSTGKIVETESVHTARLKVEEVMREGKPVFLKGPPGTGKTELAKYVSVIMGADKNLNADESFRLVSCNRDMQYSELAGNKSIKTTENGMETAFDYGPMYDCMEKGIPLILDEVNALPTETILKINEFLTRRPGDTIRVQENGGKEIKIKEGFCFVFTGNVGANYQGRFRLESSFNNRMGLIMDYDYVPNVSGVTDTIEDHAGKSELWHIMLATFMNSKGIMQIPEGDMEKMWSMSKAVRRAQDVFSGLAPDFTMVNSSGDIDAVTPAEKIKNSPISMRDVQNILGEYAKDNSMPLEYHIMQKFIIEKTDEKSREVYLTIFKSFGFFVGDSGCSYEVKNGKVNIIIDEAKLKKDRKGINMKVYSSRDTVRLAFGSAPITPESQETEYIEIESRYHALLTPEEKLRREKELKDKLERENKLKEAEDKIKELENIMDVNSVTSISKPSETKTSELLEKLKLTPNLDSTFENKDFHTINMKPLTHEQALTNYENSGGKTWIWPNLKTEMPYIPQQPKQLDVVSLQFPDPFKRKSENIVSWMTENKLRPLTYEEHIEYITTHPKHQEEKHLISLGTKHMLNSDLQVPDANLGGGERNLNAVDWSNAWDAVNRFLAVPVSA